MLQHSRILILVVVAIVWMSHFAAAQSTTRYIYDDNGRLRAVVSSTGDATIYDYDAAGNIAAIRQVPPTHLELLSFSPHQGVPGDVVTFLGVGFGNTMPTVAFVGANAQVTSFNNDRITATVPAGIVDGFITITTANGTVQTAEPFRLNGVLLSPTSVALFPNQSQQFIATVFTLDPDTSVRWSVNGIEGGNSSIGIISTSGLFISPPLPSTVIIRATSNADSSLFAEATVTLRSVNGLRGPVSAGLLVRRDTGQVNVPSTWSPTSAGVLIDRQSVPPPVMFNEASVSAGVLVQRVSQAPTVSASFNPISQGVLVNRQVGQVSPSPQFAPLSPGVLIQRNGPGAGITGNSSAFSAGVLVNKAVSVSTTPNSFAGISPGVLVNRPIIAVGAPNGYSPVSSGVLVQRSVTQSQSPNSFAPLSSGVLVQRTSVSTSPSNTIFVTGNGVLVYNGPIFTSIAPNTLTVGSSSNVTIAGSNLSGLTAIYVLTASGGIDSLIVPSNTTVSPDGSSLTTTLTVGASSPPGNRFIVLQTNRGRSLVLSPNANLLTIQ